MKILVPIRYPLTKQSTHTLTYATEFARNADSAEMFVLHVNLFQGSDRIITREIAQAIEPIVGDLPVSVIVSGGFLLEEIILEEATQLDADVIVLGENRQPKWRRALSRLFGSGPDIGAFLDDQTEARIERAT